MSTDDHYISKVYLKRFCNTEGLLVPYYKNNPYQQVSRPKSPRSVCKSQGGDTNKYFKNPEAIKEYLVPLENKWNNIIDRLQANEHSYHDKYNLCRYLAFLITATPTASRLAKVYLEEFVDPRETANLDSLLYKCIREDLMQVTSISRLDDEVKVQVDVDFAKALGVNGIEDIANRLYCSHWNILENKTDFPFLTSDNPACLYEIPESDKVAMYVPLTPEIAILTEPNKKKNKLSDLFVEQWHHKSDLRGITKKNIVKILNTLIVKSAENVIFSADRLNWVEGLTEKYCDWRVYAEQVTESENIVTFRSKPMKKK